MANTTLTADVIAKTALAVLDNEFGWMKKLHRAYEDEFTDTVNGYKKGATISIRRPADLTVRTGATMDVQDVIEGKVQLTVDQQIGVDFQFNSTDLTLSMNQITERVIKPAMTNVVNHMANDVLTQMCRGTYNWVGTPGTQVNSFADFAKAPERLDEMAVPMSDRCAILNPNDHWGVIGNQTSLYIQGPASDAYRKGELGMIAGIPTYMSQVMPTHTNGTWDATTPLIDGNSQEVSYDTAKNTWTQSLVTDGWDASATIKAGSVFTITGVYMVNPKTKQSTGIEQQFVVTADVTANATTTADTTLTISPPLITSGPHQTVTYSGNLDGKAIVPVGTASASHKQNIVFHKNSMALAVVPMESPEGAKSVSRHSHNGISVRLIPTYDAVNDISKWRMDLLYGRKLIDPRLLTRLSGTA